MALETGTSINDLVITNPTSTDAKSQGDDHFRLVKTAAKHDLNGFTKGILMYAADTGSATAHVLTPTTALTAYGPGQILCYAPANANGSGAVTVNVSGLGAKSIKTNAGDDPTANSIAAGKLLWLMYDGTNFVTIAGSAYLSKTGNQTFTGNLTLTGNQTVSGTFGATGAVTFGSTLAVTGASTFTGDLTGTGADKKADKAGSTYTGTHDYSGAASVIVPTATTGGQAVNKTQLDATAFSAALPSQTGNAGKYVTTDGTTASWAAVTPPQVVREARTSNTILAVADSQKLIDITSGTFTQTFTAAATLGSGWFVYLRNSGTGDVTLDPNGAETIDGRASFVMYPGETRLVQCNGTGFNSVVLTPFTRVFTTTEAFVKPAGYMRFYGTATSGGNSGQRTNSTGTLARGGAGGGTAPFDIPASAFANSETITIGAGGASVTTVADGNLGGTTSIGSLFSVFAGASYFEGGSVVSGRVATAPVGFEGQGSSTSPGTSIWGGSGPAANAAADSASSIYGGAAGGSLTAAGVVRAPGTSKFAGNGGAASIASNGTDGTAPGGGGGATQTGTQSGAGARGEVRITGA